MISRSEPYWYYNHINTHRILVGIIQVCVGIYIYICCVCILYIRNIYMYIYIVEANPTVLLHVITIKEVRVRTYIMFYNKNNNIIIICRL